MDVSQECINPRGEIRLQLRRDHVFAISMLDFKFGSHPMTTVSVWSCFSLISCLDGGAGNFPLMENKLLALFSELVRPGCRLRDRELTSPLSEELVR